MAECATCVHWAGDDSKYIDRCLFHSINTSFNNGCTDHREREPVLKAGENLPKKLEEARDYNNMRMGTYTATYKLIYQVSYDGGETWIEVDMQYYDLVKETRDVILSISPATFCNGLSVKDLL